MYLEIFQILAYPFRHWTSLRSLSLLSRINYLLQSNGTSFEASSPLEIIPQVCETGSGTEVGVVRARLRGTFDWLGTSCYLQHRHCNIC